MDFDFPLMEIKGESRREMMEVGEERGNALGCAKWQRLNLEKANPLSKESWGRALNMLGQKHKYDYRNIIQAN